MEKFRTSLQKVLNIKPSIFNYEQKLEISIQIAVGLISLHTENLKLNQYDLKPDNVLIDY
jgi:serine/threonine protein kinase